MLDRVVPGARIYIHAQPVKGGDPRTLVTWNGRHLRPSGASYEAYLHDIAHVLVAPAERRHIVECGLGPDPYREGHMNSTQYAAVPFVVTSEVASCEEYITCCLQAILTVSMGLSLGEVMEEVGAEEPTLDTFCDVMEYAPDALPIQLWNRARHAVVGRAWEEPEEWLMKLSHERMATLFR